MANKFTSVVDRIEELIDEAVIETDWDASEFFQDLREVCLKYKDDTVRDAIKRLGCDLPNSEGRKCYGIL